MTTSPSTETVTRTRPRVYGAFLERGRVLVVRRSDGPLAGRLDLPGGAPDPDEQFSETLARTLHAETGGRVVATGTWNALVPPRGAACGDHVDVLDHAGVWCTVLLADVGDSGALEWLAIDDWEDAADLSPALRAVLDAVAF